jgi:hypothetical protein
MDGWMNLGSEENVIKDRTNPGSIAIQILLVLFAASNITDWPIHMCMYAKNQMLFRIKTESRLVRFTCVDGCRQG